SPRGRSRGAPRARSGSRRSSWGRAACAGRAPARCARLSGRAPRAPHSRPPERTAPRPPFSPREGTRSLLALPEVADQAGEEGVPRGVEPGEPRESPLGGAQPLADHRGDGGTGPRLLEYAARRRRLPGGRVRVSQGGLEDPPLLRGGEG